jgi:hypothetical protein
MALGSALLLDHRAAEAAALVSRDLAIPPRPDPWTIYVFPDWRFFSTLLAELRREVAR